MNRLTTEFGLRRPSANRIPLASLPVALLVVSLFAAPAAASAADLGVDQSFAVSNKHQRTCSLATLKGRYISADAGTLLPPAFGVTAPTLAANAGFETFNGDGTGMDTVTLRVDGVIQFHNIAASTKYTLKPNCTGTIAVTVNGNPGPTFDIFVAPDGEAFAIIATDPGNYASGIARRVDSDD